ncbi:hypothetical protein HanRHA438_Chr00c05g0845251 [Helianthus annuus]|nr:hypothetical protein HanRHA438_Chr00c05g0845251 [Helianthus annuus]
MHLHCLDWKVWGPADARLGPAPDPHTAPLGLGSAQAATHSRVRRASLFLFLSHIPIHTYIYIHKGFIPHPPRSIPSKPLLRGAYVAAHLLQAHPNHTF